MPPKKASHVLAAGVALAAIGAVRATEEGASVRDRTLAVERLHFNMLANSSFGSRAASENLPLPQWFSVLAATNTSPIEVAIPIPHGLGNGDTVVIKGVAGDTAANGWWKITVRTPTTFALEGSDGNGDYAGGGSVFPAAGQPPPPGPADEQGELLWTPWFSGPAAFPQSEFFRIDAGVATGEIYSFPQLPTVPEPTLVTSFASQEIDGSLFRPGENLCLSIEAKVTEPATDRQKLTMIVTAALGQVRVYRTSFPGSQMTDQYQRFAICFALEPDAVTEGGVVRVEFLDEMARGAPPRAMIWRRPMLSEGTQPIPWTPSVQPLPRTHAFY
ncbi:MAG TPA: hypothetical protein VGA31_12690 [Thermoanaerobaculia bacterium]